jgi:hypothetical protein
MQFSHILREVKRMKIQCCRNMIHRHVSLPEDPDPAATTGLRMGRKFRAALLKLSKLRTEGHIRHANTLIHAWGHKERGRRLKRGCWQGALFKRQLYLQETAQSVMERRRSCDSLWNYIVDKSHLTK